MRYFHISLLIAGLAQPAVADEFTLTSRVSAATIFSRGAIITRDAQADLPAGQHRILIDDLPLDADLATLRIFSDAGNISALHMQRENLPSPQKQSSPKRAALEAQIEALEARLLTFNTNIDEQENKITAAQLQQKMITYLAAPAHDGATSLPMELWNEALTELGDAAQNAAHNIAAANREIARLHKEMAPLETELSHLQHDLDLLGPEYRDRARLILNINTQSAGPANFTLHYLTQVASWSPTYELHLESEKSILAMERAALIQQDSDEDWQQVNIALSTYDPDQRTEPSEIWGELVDIIPISKLSRLTSEAAKDASVVPQISASERIGTEALDISSFFAGETVIFTLDHPIDLASGGQIARQILERGQTNTNLFARANFTHQSFGTAFQIAEITNDFDAILLRGPAQLYRDGAFVGEGRLEETPLGASTEIGFGQIESLSLTRIKRNKEDGATGVISRANERISIFEIIAENHGAKTQPLRIRQSMPYSEREDIEIEINSEPQPDSNRAGDKRGVYEWRFALEPGAKRHIQFDYRIKWPDGQELNFYD